MCTLIAGLMRSEDRLRQIPSSDTHATASTSFCSIFPTSVVFLKRFHLLLTRSSFSLTLSLNPAASPSTGPARPPTLRPTRRRPAGHARTGSATRPQVCVFRLSRTYCKILQVDHDGEGHAGVLAGRHHAPPQRDDPLRAQQDGVRIQQPSPQCLWDLLTFGWMLK